MRCKMCTDILIFIFSGRNSQSILKFSMKVWSLIFIFVKHVLGKVYIYFVLHKPFSSGYEPNAGTSPRVRFSLNSSFCSKLAKSFIVSDWVNSSLGRSPFRLLLSSPVALCDQ